ncbi:MAG: cell division protein SepF [Clostridia bacterium]|nr:cell division protein SepF [Clostridia bacterium]
MGLFDFFERKEKRNAIPETDIFDNTEEQLHTNKTNPVSVFKPQKYSDVELIIDALKEGKNAVVHLNGLKHETAQRIIDMLSGALYALGGGIYELEQGTNIFMLSPAGVIVNK